jgi:hypothetical protein
MLRVLETVQNPRTVTPREADIAFALEGVEGIEAVYAIASRAEPSAGELQPSVEVVIRIRPFTRRIEAHVSSRLATAFAFEPPPFVLMVDADAAAMPRLMQRATEIVLSPVERKAAVARRGLREMRRHVVGSVAATIPPPISCEIRDRRSCILIVDPQSIGIERSLRRLDAEVRVVSRASRALLDIAAAEISWGEVDVVLFDARASTERLRQFYVPVEKRFGISARDHFFLIVGELTYGAKQLVARYADLPVPLDMTRFASILDNATRWRRVPAGP